jgi:hypothetical protein
MSDRHAGYIVTLEKNVKDEDSEATMDAIRQLRGVVDVRPIVSDVQHHTARMQVRAELGVRLMEVLYPEAAPQVSEVERLRNCGLSRPTRKVFGLCRKTRVRLSQTRPEFENL